MFRRFALLAVLAMLGSMLTVSWAGPATAFVDRDCSDFDSQAQAQKFYVDAGGPRSDPHRLDADGDGRACDTLPCPCSSGTSGGGGAGGSTGSTVRQKARVLRVVDGDTVKVRLNGGGRRTVRLLGIDTPEVHGGAECGGAPASRSLKRLLPRGAKVRLVSDPTQARTDRYGRLLRYVVRIRDGRDIDRVQVLRGWATVYVHANKPFKRVASYRTAQRAAQAAGRGIWGRC